MDIKKAVSDIKGGKIDFKVEKAGIIHAAIESLFESKKYLKMQKNSSRQLSN